ncbi:MAG: HAD-IA family hydrolase [Candidatus Moraniibacteriota bacterium]
MSEIKAVLLDADGLMFKKQRYFSEILYEKYGVPAEAIIPFFKTQFRECQKGSADLKEELVPFLKLWNWDGDVESFLAYWFSYCIVDDDVLSIIRELRVKGLKCYLVTDQEKYRGEYIKRNLGLERELDGFFYSFEMKSSKSEAKFYGTILETLHFAPEEVIFFDDEEENIETAKCLGIDSVLVTGEEDFGAVVERNIQG